MLFILNVWSPSYDTDWFEFQDICSTARGAPVEQCFTPACPGSNQTVILSPISDGSIYEMGNYGMFVQAQDHCNDGLSQIVGSPYQSFPYHLVYSVLSARNMERYLIFFSVELPVIVNVARVKGSFHTLGRPVMLIYLCRHDSSEDSR